MFAINHAATALLLRRRFPELPLSAALISVQFVEFVWVLLNYLGIERTITEPVVRSIADIHLAHMPLSHSVVTTALFAVAGAAVAWRLTNRRVAMAIAAGIASHLVLDVLTHNPDIAIVPFISLGKLGTGLYALPAAAFAVELTYGIFCWWYFHGSRSLLAVIVLFNFANLSIFFPSIPGPEHVFANRPMLLVSVILAQIVATLVLVGITARSSKMSHHAQRRPPSDGLSVDSGRDPGRESPLGRTAGGA